MSISFDILPAILLPETGQTTPTPFESLQSRALAWFDTFMERRDSTIRYLAISLLAKFATTQPDILQQYRTTVLACMRQNDVSLQRKAVHLAYGLIDESNAVEMITEFLNLLLVLADPIPTADTSPAPAGKDIAFADGTHVVVSDTPTTTLGTKAEEDARRALTDTVIDMVSYNKKNDLQSLAD